MLVNNIRLMINNDIHTCVVILYEHVSTKCLVTIVPTVHDNKRKSLFITD